MQPFNDEINEFEKKVHLRYQKRNKRKGITKIEGLENYDIDLKKFIKEMKKKLCCNGALVTDKITKSKVIQFQGDHRETLKKVLIDKYSITKDNITTHGA